MKKRSYSTAAAIALSLLTLGCLSSSTLAEEPSIQEAVQTLRGIQVDKLSEKEKQSKAIELDRAWQTLGRGGEPAAKALREAVAAGRQNNTQDDFFSLAAAHLLWKIGGAAEAEEIGRIWQTSRQPVNYNYVYATALMAARTRDPRVLPMLKALLHEKDGRFFVAQHSMMLRWPQTVALAWETYGPAGLASLEEILNKSTVPAEIEIAALLLTRAQQITALPRLRQLVKHQDRTVRQMAVQSLGMFGHPTDYPLLIDGLQSKHSDELTGYIVALAQYGDPKAVWLIAPHLSAAAPAVRKASLQALLQLPCPEALAAIQKREQTASSPEEKQACRRNLERFSPYLQMSLEEYGRKSPAEQQALFADARKRHENELLAIKENDRKLSREEFLDAAKQWQQEHRITGTKFQWVEDRHVLAIATLDDLPLLMEVRARVCERVSDECLDEIATLNELIFRLGRGRYRQDTGPLPLPHIGAN